MVCGARPAEALPAFVLISLWILPQAAHAQSPPFSWTAPANCPSQAEVRDALSATLGSRFADGPPVHIVVTEQPDGYRGEVEGPRGAKRTIEAVTCDELVGSLSVVAALMVLPAAVEGAEPAEESTPAGPVPGDTEFRPLASPTATLPASATATAALTPAPGASPRPAPALGEAGEPEEAAAPANPEVVSVAEGPALPTERHFIVAAGVRGDLGLLPRAAAAPVLLLGYQGLAWEAHLQLAYFPQITRAGPSPAEGAFAATTVGLEAGWRFVHGAKIDDWSLAAVGGAELGILTAEANNISQPESVTAPLVSVSATMQAKLPLTGRLHTVIRASALVPLIRPDFEVSPLGRLHRVSSVGGRVELLLGLSL